MCWEALNNIAAGQDRPLVIVVNDNGRSYAPTIGGLAEHLAALRLNPGYESVLDVVGDTASPLVGRPLYEALHGIKGGHQGRVARRSCSRTSGSSTSVRSTVTTSRLWRAALRRAKTSAARSSCTAVTRKGFGYAARRGRRGRPDAQPSGVSTR